MTWAKRRAIVIGFLILFIVVIIWAAARPMRLASNSVLLIDASGEITEQRSPGLFGLFDDDSVPVLHEYLDAIDAARTDPHIAGIVVRMAPLDTGWGKIEEIREHLLSFQSSGKPSICYLGYDGIGNPEYYLASACSQVWVVPTNPVDIRGMMAEALFFRGSLDKLKIVPEFYHIAEFKTATNELTEKKFTPAHREEVEGLLHGIYGQYVHDAAQARHMTPAAFEAILNGGPLLSDDAVADKIVDRLAYWDQVQEFFTSRTGGWNPVSLSRYRAFVPSVATGSAIAIVHATGLIVSGESEDSSHKRLRDGRGLGSLRHSHRT